MWPQILDFTKDECKKMLRRLELEAYYSIITAFRAQGDLTKEKKKVLHDLCNLLGISMERHRAEIRRAVNDEKLNTIANQIAGCGKSSEWAIEGRRLIPLMPRLVPQTAFTVFANNAANMAAAQNASMPPPCTTRNKRESANVSSDVEATPLKPASGNKPVTLAPQSLNSASHTTQTHSSSQIQTEGESPWSLDNFADEVENHLYSVQESNTNSAAPGSIVMLPGGMPVHVNEGLSGEDKNLRRKRSPSLDISSTPQKVVALSKSSAAPQRASPVQVTGTVTTSGQKVILVSTSGSNLPSSILQRTLGGQVKAISTMASTSQTQIKSSLIPPISTSSAATTSVSSCTPRLKGKGAVIPATSQPSTATAHTQTLQIRPGVSSAKPTFQFKDGSGLKIITQALPVSGVSAKMIAKPSGSSSSSPIVVVTKTASLAPGAQPGTRVVNVITTQASSGKVLMPASFSMAKNSGSSALVAVGSKGRPKALVKMAPTMSLTSQGGKPNLFVVQKAHLAALSSGNAVPIPASVAACAQTVLRPNFESGQVEKASQIEMKSTVLADLLQAAGILPDGASSDIQTVELMDQADSKEDGKVNEQVQIKVTSTPAAVEQWVDLGDQSIPVEGQQSKQQHILEPHTADLAVELPKTISKQLNSPSVDEDSISLETRPTDVVQAANQTMMTMDLLKQAGVDIGPKIVDKGQPNKESTSTPSFSTTSEPSHVPPTLVHTTPGEHGELDPTTGIFYPYTKANQAKPTLLQPISTDVQTLQQPVTPVGNVPSTIPAIKIEVELPGAMAATGNSAHHFEASQVSTQKVKDEISEPDLKLSVGFDIPATDKSPLIHHSHLAITDQEISALTLPHEQNPSVFGIKTEVEEKESGNVLHTATVSVSAMPSPTSQPLYQGATYSKEEAIARKKAVPADRDDDLGEMQPGPPDLANPQGKANADSEEVYVTADDVVVEEILECEEVHFTDDNMFTGVIEETVVTMDEREHSVLMESTQSRFNLEPDNLVEDDFTAGESVPSGPCDSLPNIKPEDASEADVCSTVDDFQQVAFPALQVSIKDMLASSQSHPSGSSIFMVTDSVVESDSLNLTLGVPLPDDIVAVEQIELSEESSGKILTTEDESYSSCGSPKDHSQIDPVGEEIDPTASAGAGKRKRKPTNKAGSMEESPSAAHLVGWAKSAMGLLLRVMKFRGSGRVKGGLGASHWFLHPVSEDEAPGYHQVVKYPMDFSTIKKKLESGCYQDLTEFNQDMNLVKINCDMFNPPLHEARLDCEEVFVFYNQEYDKLTQRWQKPGHSFQPNQKKLKFS